MSRRRQAVLVSFAVAPVVAVGIFVGLVFATKSFLAPVIVALVAAGAVAALGSRLAGYGVEERETGKLVGWPICALLTSFLAIVVSIVIAIIVIVETCDNCFD